MDRHPHKNITDMIRGLKRLFPEGDPKRPWENTTPMSQYDALNGLSHGTTKNASRLMSDLISSARRVKRDKIPVSEDSKSRSLGERIDIARAQARKKLDSWKKRASWSLEFGSEPSVRMESKSYGTIEYRLTIPKAPLLKAMGWLNVPGVLNIAVDDYLADDRPKHDLVPVGIFAIERYMDVDDEMLRLQTINLEKVTGGYRLVWGWSAYVRRGEREYLATHRDMDKARTALTKRMLIDFEKLRQNSRAAG